MENFGKDKYLKYSGAEPGFIYIDRFSFLVTV